MFLSFCILSSLVYLVFTVTFYHEQTTSNCWGFEHENKMRVSEKSNDFQHET